MQANTNLLNQAMLTSLKELLGEKFNQLIEAFLQDSTGRFSRLSSAAATLDFKTIKDESHGVKGSARNLGADSLAELCGEIENQARAENAENLVQKISAAEQVFAALSAELQAMLPD